MRTSKRSVPALGAALLALVGGLLVAGPTGPAGAVTGPALSVTPSGPLASGAVVEVAVTGFAAGAPVAVAECPAGRPITGPGDCGPSSVGASSLITVDGTGAGSATLTIRTGLLANAIPPSATCNTAHACELVATNIVDPTQQVRKAIAFAPVTAPALSFAPVGPFVQGDQVSVAVEGFSPSAAVTVAECPSGRPVLGAGDCGRAGDGAAQIITTDGSGGGSAVLTIRVGSLDNLTAPAATCDTTHGCDLVATNLAVPSEEVRTALSFSDEEPGSPGDPGGPGFPGEPSGLQSIALAPGGAYADGSKVSVVATGFTPNAPVFVAQCGARVVRGPGDCGRSTPGQARLVTADPAGVARATLALAYGPLGNLTPPAISCTNASLCIVSATNITDVTELAAVPIVFTGKLVRPTVSSGLSRSKVRKGKVVTFSGKVSPNATGERVLLQRKQKRGWVTKAQATVSPTSSYKIRWKATSRTDYRWRVKIAAKPWHPASVSRTRKLVVT